MGHGEGIEFVVGEEKKFTDVITEGEIMPLLKSAVAAGLLEAMILDSGDAPLWSHCADSPLQGSRPAPGAEVSLHPLFLEGEPAGKLALVGGADPGARRVMGQVLSGAINAMIHANLKRMLTTEIHTTVVQQSYEELVEINRQLAASEKKYRDLAANLEVRVQERTEELKRAYSRMIRQEKLASVGQLAAGVAHEINNPLGFVLSNLTTLQKYAGRFREMLELYRGQGGEEARRKWHSLRLDFILEDLPELFSQSIAGAERVKKIVSDLRGFSHIDGAGEGEIEVNTEIERTLSMLCAEIPPDARIHKSFGELPPVPGHAGHLCQAFLNILRNALQARPQGLELRIGTRREEQTVTVVFQDNGPGVPEEIRDRIFEPFFTTREVGQGMGLGLSVAYDSVTAMAGSIEVQGAPGGEGAVFIIQLPLGRKRDV